MAEVGKQIATALSAAAALDEDAGAFHDLVRRLGELGLQAETTYRTQAREEIFHLGDILLDYRNNSEALKVRLAPGRANGSAHLW